MGDWRTVRLEELAASERSAISKPYGSAIVKDDYRPSGIPVVRGVNLAGGLFHDDDFVFISSEIADRIPGAQLKAGDLVVTHRGTVGQVSMIPRIPRHDRYVASTSHVKVRLDPARALPEFFYYWFSSPQGKGTILAGVSTVGVPGLAQPVATVKGFAVPCPPLHEQRAIAEVLGALDDKIAANDAVRQTLNRLTDTQFTAAIQADADTCKLGDVATFHNRKRIPLSSRERQQRSGSIPYYGAAGRLDLVDEAIFDEPLVLVGEDGSVMQGDGAPVVQYIWGPSWVNNHAHVLTGSTASTETLHVAVKQANVAHLVTGAVQPKLNMRNLRSLSLTMPVGSALEQFEETVQGFAALNRSLSEESSRLAAKRDELLPLLMLGKVRVKDAEKVVEGAV